MSLHPTFVVLVAAGLVGPAAAAEPFLEKTDLFEAGKGGYALYRIPGIVVTSKGTLLAYCEARKNERGDWGHIDILLRRSTDGGKTWDEPRKVATVEGKVERNPAAVKQGLGKDGEITLNNPVAIADRSGAVHFLYCVEYARCYALRSDDDGRTFSKPVDITPTFEKFRDEYPWQVCATGPAHGIQLKSGRLLVPVWLSTGTGGHAHRPSVVATIYSDDGGKTWQRGAIVANETEPLTNPSESVVVQRADGTVLINMRSESQERRRAVAHSPDGATKWTKPTFDPQLPEPICMASIVRLTEKPAAAKNRILFANPHNPDSRERKNLTVKLSYDECRTWPVARTLEAGVSAYSDLAVGPDGTIYCFYERGAADGKSAFKSRTLCLARFNLEWLTEGKDRLDPPKN